MRGLFSGLFLILVALTGCSGSESGPVSLPIPFSGSLTSDTRVFSEGGLPVSRCLFQSRLWGCEYPLIDAMGNEVGTLIGDPNTVENFQHTEDGFESLSIIFQQITDEGTMTARVEIIGVVLPNVPTICNETEAAEFSGDPGASCIVHTGIGTGPILDATGIFAEYIGGHTEIRFLHDEALLSTGEVIGYRDDDCVLLNYKN